MYIYINLKISLPIDCENNVILVYFESPLQKSFLSPEFVLAMKRFLVASALRY